MKKPLLSLSISVIFFSSGCVQFQSKKQALLRHYEESLEAEYNEYINSETSKKFEKKYNELVEICSSIEKSPPQAFKDTLNPKDILRLGTEDEKENELNWQKWTAEGKKVSYTDFKNISSEITGVLISNEFHKNKGKTYAGEIGIENEIHGIYNDLHNTNYIKESKRYPEFSYQEFCNRRITADKINHCKYVLILNPTKQETYQYLSKETIKKGEYQTSFYEAMLYVYNMEKKEMECALKINAAGSDTINQEYRALDEAVRKDLEENIKKEMVKELNSVFKYVGTEPEVKIH